jgi:hypothetical protein
MSKHHKTPPYTVPEPGTKFPAQRNTTVDNPGENAGLAAITEWNQAQAQDNAFQKNAVLVEDWTDTGDWAHWLESYLAGRVRGPKGMGDPDAVPPTPPDAYMAVTVINEGGGVAFAVTQVPVDDGGSLACAVPEYTKIPAPQHYKG